MNILIIEDEKDYVERVRQGVASVAGHEIHDSSDVGLDEKFDHQSSLEEQLLVRLGKVVADKGIDIVLLDSDLSRIPTGISQTACREAFQTLGVPVCRYSKKHSATASSQLMLLAKRAREGSSAVWVPTETANNPEAALIPWLTAVHEGFSMLTDALEAKPGLMSESLGPAGILATVLGSPSTTPDFLGYTSQNFFFFGGGLDDSGADSTRQLATRLGYWLFNYVITFPGPILSRPAAAAFLNLTFESFDAEGVQHLLKPARYQGPFGNVEAMFWRDSIGKLLDETSGDIALNGALKNVTLKRVDEANPGSSAFLCVLTQQPIAAENAAPAPDWIPPGAQLSRIQIDIYDKLGPLLNI